ncbi:MAG: hypothetical protein J6C64_05350, partial [Lachnospiraceae bacterium]|nr:hypothetical protein [Lachnospiraceae bacterium]
MKISILHHCLSIAINKKVSSTLQLPCPSILRGLGISFFALFLHNSLMNVLQKIFKDHFEEI